MFPPKRRRSAPIFFSLPFCLASLKNLYVGTFWGQTSLNYFFHPLALSYQSALAKTTNIACVAGGISRASAFVVVQRSREHEWRSRERIGEESNSLANSLAGFAREGIWRLYRSPAHESRQLRRLLQTRIVFAEKKFKTEMINGACIH